MRNAVLPRPAFDLARAAFLEALYRGKSVLVIGVGDGRVLEVLQRRGAARVVGVDPDAQVVEAARRRTDGLKNVRVGGPQVAAGARFDVVMLGQGESLAAARDPVPTLRERLLPNGWLVAAAPNGDVEGQAGGVRYFDLHDRLAAHFPAVTMLGQTALVGAVIAPFGDEEVEPVLDTALQGDVTPAFYVAIAGPRRVTAPYGLVALSPSEIAIAPPVQAEDAAKLAEERRRAEAEKKRGEEERAQAEVVKAALVEREQRVRTLEAELLANRATHESAIAERDARLRAIETERRALVEELERRTGAGGEAMEHLRSQLREAEQAKDDLRERIARMEDAVTRASEAAHRHAEEMRVAEAVLAERDAYIAEMEREQRAVDRVRAEAQEAITRADNAEARERAARLRVAELEGTIIKLQAGGARAAQAADSAQLEELGKQVRELEARCEKLQARAEDAQREAWAHMRARSEAEAAAAELREDNVRKLKDARKVANLELMRQTEEALKKGITLKEELARSDKERREAIAEARALREELARERAGVEERVQAEAAAQTARALAELEVRVVAAERDRDLAVAERDALLAQMQPEAPVAAGDEGVPQVALDVSTIEQEPRAPEQVIAVAEQDIVAAAEAPVVEVVAPVAEQDIVAVEPGSEAEEASSAAEVASGGEEVASGVEEAASGGEEAASGGEEAASGGEEAASGGEEAASGGEEAASGGEEAASSGVADAASAAQDVAPVEPGA